MEDLNENEQRIKDKLDFFFNEKVCVHVQLKDKTFVNGFIEKELQSGIYWLIENRLGGIYLFLRDIYEIEEFRENEKGVKKNVD